MDSQEDENNKETRKIDKGPLLGVRHLQTLLLFLDTVVVLLNRVHVALTILAMMKTEKSNKDFPVYNWNEQQKSYILSSFYPSYILTQFPGAYSSRYFGVKINLFVLTLVTGATSLLMPWCVSWGDWQAFCVLRFIMGLSQGGFYPAIYQHLAQWSPPEERSSLSGVVRTGFDFGIATAMILTGVIATSSLGWPGSFYIYGGLCFVWCAVWLVLGANDATSSKFITGKERLYINKSLENSVSSLTEKQAPVPWRAMFSSKPLYALLAVQTAYIAGYDVVQVEWPSYVNSVLKLNIENNALFSALPSVASFLSFYIYLLISNYITKRNLLSLTVTRKCFNAFGMWIPAAGIALVGFLDETQKLYANITMMFVWALSASCYIGSLMGAIDMAPNYAQIITSIINITSNILVLLGPLFFGIVVNNEKDRSQWQIGFITIAALLCLGDLVYLIWGSSDEQPWNSANFSTVQKDKKHPETSTDFMNGSWKPTNSETCIIKDIVLEKIYGKEILKTKLNGSHENKNEDKTKQLSKGPFLGVRHLQAMLVFLHIVILYLSRMHVSLSLVAMTNSDKRNGEFPIYSWNEQQKSYVLSSFYWGYILTQFAGAYCSRRFGVKITLFIFTLVTGLSSLLMPYCISWGDWYAFSVLRFLMGLAQGGFYPSALQHLAKWSAPNDRSLFSGFAHTGFEIGVVLSLILTGIIATSALSWPGSFYIYGALCFVWCALWQLFGANDMNSSNLISTQERLYLEESLKNSVNFEESRLPVPWRAIFHSKPFYALLIVRAVTVSGFVTLQIEWPIYVNSVLKFNIKSNSLFSALPFMASWLSIYLFLFISNFVVKLNFWPLTVTRKCFNAFGMWLPAAGIAILGFLDEAHKMHAIITMTLVMGLHSSCNMGSVTGPIDMAPNHTEMITSIINTSANILALIGPLFVGIVVNNEKDRSQWQIAFITIAVLLCFGDLVYLIWGSSKEQPWNSVDYPAVEKAKSLPDITTDFRNGTLKPKVVERSSDAQYVMD